MINLVLFLIDTLVMNIRLIYDLINYLTQKRLPGLLLCLYFEKAFDSLDWQLMFKVLKAFGFGNDVCRWVDTFYKDIKEAVIVNGQIPQWFNRQRDPISPYLFIMCVEILAIMIREDEAIKGIYINKVGHTIFQFADDTQLMNSGDRKSFEKSIHVVNKFGTVFGLFINADKIQAIWLSRKNTLKTKYVPHLQVIWNPHMFKIACIRLT